MDIIVYMLPMEMKDLVVRIGGVVSYYDELNEVFDATFIHHEIKTKSNQVIITDDLTSKYIAIDKVDFYTIKIL